MPLVVSIYIIYSYLYVHIKVYRKQFSSSRGDGRNSELSNGWVNYLSFFSIELKICSIHNSPFVVPPLIHEP